MNRSTRLTIFLFVFLFGISSLAAADTRLEHIKAAYIYNFTKFIKWNDSSSNADFAVCILGKNNFQQVAKNLAKKTVNGVPIEVRFINSFEDANSCKILYISRLNTALVNDDLKANIKLWNVLTISDIDEFHQYGGIITFYVSRGKLKFIVNNRAGKEAGLVFSSQLLEVAGVVIE